LGPATVVVANSWVTQQIGEHEPRMRGALTYTAVGHYVLVGRDILTAVDSLKLLLRLERAILLYRCGPGDVLRAGDVAAALRPLLRIVHHVQQLARVLRVGAHVHKPHAFVQRLAALVEQTGPRAAEDACRRVSSLGGPVVAPLIAGHIFG